MENNPVINKLPKHLLNLVIDQDYKSYTALDHAVWRYVMRQNLSFLPNVATGSYLDGLKKTGICIEAIPDMYGMNRILKDIGWAAVAVDGFIPPSAFMEFQAYNVLVIAADIRSVDQIAYTPAPDIIHEAAGHAPIIADPVYADYLKIFGEIGCKAFSSAKDYEIYEAIRHLSILKADPYTPEQEILEAEKNLERLEQNPGEPSEMSLIRNLHWWTVEYGLIGTLENPKIYGAGLLSSIGESYHCMQDDVIKLPYTIDAVNYGFDITKPQPQLFVTPDFDTLIKVLNEFTDTMAVRTGGKKGIIKAIDSENTATCVYSSGLQISGTFTDIIDQNDSLVYIKTTGPTSLCYDNKELPGHGKSYHKDGFGSPVGKLKGINLLPENLTESNLAKLGIITGKEVNMIFESGITVKGILNKQIRMDSRLLLLSFSDCQVKYYDTYLFQPEWGIFDMAIGSEIVSAYSGPADPEAFELTFDAPNEKTHKIIYTDKDLRLHSIYKEIRNIREGNCSYILLPSLWDKIKSEYPGDWLAALEIFELLVLKEIKDSFYDEVKSFLISRMNHSKELHKLISDGISILNQII